MILQEIWGSEVVVYYPGLYAGATDVVGVYDYEDSIIDFKQSNKPKRKEWIMIILCSSEPMRWLITMCIEPRSLKG